MTNSVDETEKQLASEINNRISQKHQRLTQSKSRSDIVQKIFDLLKNIFGLRFIYSNQGKSVVVWLGCETREILHQLWQIVTTGYLHTLLSELLTCASETAERFTFELHVYPEDQYSAEQYFADLGKN